MGDTNKSILSLNNAFHLKKVFLILNIFQKPLGWVVFFFIFFKKFYIGNKEFIVFCVYIIML